MKMKKLNTILIAPFSFACLFLLLAVSGGITAALSSENIIGLIAINTVAAVLSAVAFILAAIPLKYINTDGRDEPVCPPSVSALRCVLLSLAALVILFTVSIASSLLLPGENSSSVMTFLEALPPKGIMRTLMIASLILRHALVPAVTEELYFRHKLSDALTRVGTKPPIVLIVTSLMFGALHRGGIAPVLLATISGAVLWLLARLTGRIGYPIAVHFIYNLMIIVIMAICPGSKL